MFSFLFHIGTDKIHHAKACRQNESETEQESEKCSVKRIYHSYYKFMDLWIYGLKIIVMTISILPLIYIIIRYTGNC
jgi:hypothetical protein